MGSDGSEMTFATGFVISGRDSQLTICEFESTMANILQPGRNDFSVEVLFSRRGKWTAEGGLTLHVDPDAFAGIGEKSIQFDNANSLPEEVRKSILPRALRNY
jgi:hypothetical protein